MGIINSMKKKALILLTVVLAATACNVPQEDKATGEKGTSFDASVIEDDTITNLYDAFGKKIDGLTKDFGFSVYGPATFNMYFYLS